MYLLRSSAGCNTMYLLIHCDVHQLLCRIQLIRMCYRMELQTAICNHTAVQTAQNPHWTKVFDDVWEEQHSSGTFHSRSDSLTLSRKSVIVHAYGWLYQTSVVSLIWSLWMNISLTDCQRLTLTCDWIRELWTRCGMDSFSWYMYIAHESLYRIE